MTEPLPKMSVDPARPGMIRFDDIPMGGMLAGISAPEIVRACNAHEALLDAARLAVRALDGRVHSNQALQAMRDLKSAIAKAETA